jgi:hypothetical protein
MSTNGKAPEPSTDGQVLRWTGRVLTAVDLRQALNGHRELVIPERAILSPLAADELRARGVRVTVQRALETALPAKGRWGVAQDRPYPEVAGVVQSLRRDGVEFHELPACTGGACSWSRSLAECVAQGECVGGVVFCQDAGLVCCVANKVAGLRAVPLASVPQATRACSSLSPNLVAIEMPGRTFYEIRQVLRCACLPEGKACPDGVATTLRELDGHAHR